MDDVINFNENYSLNEQKIGIWMEGYFLYKRSFLWNNPTSITGNITTPTFYAISSIGSLAQFSLVDVDFIVKVQGSGTSYAKVTPFWWVSGAGILQIESHRVNNSLIANTGIITIKYFKNDGS